ncbi:MAG: hypothetical protein ABIN89_20385 [Chitinophagaceae bacterium]
MKLFLSLPIFCLFGNVFLLLPSLAISQDSSITISRKVITLTEVVVRNNLNVAGFIDRVQKDTSFYKAFKNLRILGYTALNDIRMIDKKGNIQASLQSKTIQSVHNGCRSMETFDEKATGNIYDKKKNWNYYTAELYAGLFFTNDTVCNENNIVKGDAMSAKGKSGIQKHKEQLKMLMFSPGSKIPGIPFIGNKVAIFEEEESTYYDFIIDMENYQGQNCYLFTIKAREDLKESEKDNIVINKITTWFNSQTMEIVARNYDLSYKAGLYDFDVHMQVEMDKVDEYLVPKLIRYSGNWHAIFKKRENGVFTATLFDFRK